MVRVGKWDEQKVLFKNAADGGHAHGSGTDGSRLGDGAINSSLMIATSIIHSESMGTGCMKWSTGAAGAATCKKMWFGTVTKTRQDGTQMTVWMNGATGFTQVEFFEAYSTSDGIAGGAGTVVVGYFDTAAGTRINVSPRGGSLYLPVAMGIGGGAGPDGVYLKVWGT